MTEALIVLITTNTHESAHQIAEKLVEERLAACVNIIPQIESIYRWEGRICRDQELLLIAKTEQPCFTQLETTVRALHGYTTPEIIALPIDSGSAPYLKWLTESLKS
ncbi:MAG: divalent-cation tolerance protein CutA [Acidobacteriota bacterium]